MTTGHVAALTILSLLEGHTPTYPSDSTAVGALLDHIIRKPEKGRFTPTNINYSLIAAPAAELKKMRKKEKQAYYSKRALDEMSEWVSARFEQ